MTGTRNLVEHSTSATHESLSVEMVKSLTVTLQRKSQARHDILVILARARDLFVRMKLRALGLLAITACATCVLGRGGVKSATAYDQSFYDVRTEEAYVSIVYDILGEYRIAEPRSNC
jgi:hypothetical protein